MSGLKQRIVSAIFLAGSLFASYYFFSSKGLMCYGLLFCLIGVYEYQKIIFLPTRLRTTARISFILTSFLIMLLNILPLEHQMALTLLILAGFFSGQLWLLKDKMENSKLLSVVSLSALGFVYAALLPVFGLKILSLDHGAQWFLLLVSVVFAGDITAYFGGILFGKRKLMPSLSPGKTFAGAVTGLIGSVCAGYLVWFFGLAHIPLYWILFYSLVAALLAQNGDLIESLMKRVSSVKDSGSIFPGHGGVLDRLDGIYFASPAIYIAAVMLSN